MLTQIEDEAPLTSDRPSTRGWMQRLCRAAARHLPALGVGVSLLSENGNQVTFAASSTACEAIEELQFVLGEGPGLDAHISRRPVLTPDLAEPESPWPGYADAVLLHSVRACFAFPLQVGAARLGTLTVYRDTNEPLLTVAMHRALLFAEIALGGLLDIDHLGGGIQPSQQHRGDTGFERYQAQGMVMVQLGVDLTQAMARMRAHAYAHDRRLSEVAMDIVAGKLILEPDDV